MILDLLAAEKRGTVERWVRSNTHSATMPKGDTLCRVLGEWPFVVTLEDLSVAPHLVLNGYWEMWMTMCVARRVKPGWQCIDVGANLGYYTVLLAHLVGEAGRVEAWEPQLGLIDRLRKTLRLNGLADSERVLVRNVAAGSELGQGRIYADKEDRGGATVARTAEGPVAIQPITDTQLSRVDFVKIDAEGAEAEIWRGGIGFLKPKAVLLEWSPEKYTDPPEFMARIREDGYTVGVVNQDGDVDIMKTAEEHAALSGIRGWKALWLERRP